MQTFSFYSIICAVLILFLVTYAQQPVKDNTLRMIYLDSAKPDALAQSPSPQLSTRLSTSDEFAAADEGPEVVTLSGQSSGELATELIIQQTASDDDPQFAEAPSDITVASAELVKSLPAEYDQFDPTVDLTPDSLIGQITFSTEIDEFDLIALSPERVFEEGSFTIYATFEYDGLAEGMVWSWVWRRDGQVVSGGNEVWVYGEDGPGYVFYNPREGFSEGEYTLEIWVNQDLMKEANLFVTSDIAASR